MSKQAYSGKAPRHTAKAIARAVRRVQLYRTDRHRWYHQHRPQLVARELGVALNTLHKWARGEVPVRYFGQLLRMGVL